MNAVQIASNVGVDIELAVQCLRNSELAAIPTETVYGLAGNAYDAEAVTKIFKTKNRPNFDPLIVHTDSLEKIKIFTHSIPDVALALAEKFWPGPLTLLLPKNNLIPDIVTSGSPLVAVRIPNQPLTLSLLRSLEFPLAAPSANPFGYVSPTTAAHVEKQLGDKIAYILDGGACPVGVESTIIGFPPEGVTVYRTGGLPLEEIQKTVGALRATAYSSSSPMAPGMLKSHYATHAPMFQGKISDLLPSFDPKKVGLITFQNFYHQVPENQQFVLSPSGHLDEAAARLFAAMRALDEMKLQAILTEFFPNEGLGRAINDRLLRATAKRA